MSELMSWARKEVELASKNCDEYGAACLNSALKALYSLSEDGHSGYSIGATQSILNSLIKYKPLTPLTGDDSEWGICCSNESDEYISYQNNRYSALFKHVYKDGSVEYNDIDRFVLEDIGNGSRWSNGSAFRLIEGYFPPISFPYSPNVKPIVIYMEEFLLDERNGDFDHRALFYAIDQQGTKTDINIYQKEINGEFQIISKDEYLKDRELRIR